MSVKELIQEASKLSAEERQALIDALTTMASAATVKKERSLLELRGLGKDIWQGIDAQAYVDAERDEWENHP